MPQVEMMMVSSLLEPQVDVKLFGFRPVAFVLPFGRMKLRRFSMYFIVPKGILLCLLAEYFASYYSVF